MSDRLATLCADIRTDLETAHERANTDEQQTTLKKAATLVRHVEEQDREQNGPTPEDKLTALVSQTDECLNCGETIDDGGWCSWSCFQEWGDDTDA